LTPARVGADLKFTYTLLTGPGELGARLDSSLRREARKGQRPVVGDWVGYRESQGDAVIVALLERTSKFSRKAAFESREQVLAANADTVFLIMSLVEDFNLRRLERYLAAGQASGATPVVVLTKADLDYPRERLEAVKDVAQGVRVEVVSNTTGAGLDALADLLTPGRTVALLGSSGAGKSTLVNRLLGADALATQELRANGQGRHTTSSRQLIPLPGGALVIDTPGLRELAVWEAASADTFPDIEALALECRFSDCRHDREPGCAVKQAVSDGTLLPARLAAFKALEQETSVRERRR
jgi:ribosome biogenesis GTPase